MSNHNSCSGKVKFLCPGSILLRCLLLLIFCQQLPLQAQEQSFLHYDTRNGLAGSVVHGITQDHDGFIWFCTETGLSRFDGKRFRNYTRKDGLPSNEVFQTFTDSRNRLWIVSFKNAICYYYNGNIYNQHNDEQLRRLNLGCQVDKVYETHKGEILLKMVDENYYVLPVDKQQPATYIAAWQPFDAQLAERLRLIPVKIQLPAFHNNAVIRQQLLRDSTYYCGFMELPDQGVAYIFQARDGLRIVPGDATQNYKLPLPDLMFCKMLGNGLLGLVSTRAGVSLYDLHRRRVTATYLTQQKVHDIFRDREGNLWFSTNGSGVYQLNNPAFRDYRFGNTRQTQAVQHIFRHRGTLQVVTDYGSCSQLQPVPGSDRDSVYTVQPGTFGMEKILSQPNRIMHFSNAGFDSLLPGRILPRSTVKTLFYERDTLYIAHASGVFSYKVTTCKILDTLLPSRSTCTYKLGNTIFIGTINGLYTYDNGKLNFAGDRYPLLRNRISTLTAGAGGILWIGTYEEGVIGLKNNRIIARITEAGNGLSSNICRCLYVSGPYLWIGTEKGINKVDIGNSGYRVTARYDVSDGLPSDIINALYTEGNMVYAGTQTGLTIFDESLIARRGSCSITFTGISVSGKTLQDTEALSLTLRHKDHNIHFEYTGISFLSAGRISYRYRLLGLNDQWLTTPEQAVDYPSLPSGSYVFQVKAVNKFGSESAVLEQAFKILPSFWERGMVQLAILLLLLLLALLLLQLRIRYVRGKDRQQQAIRKQMMDLEQMALRAQMNPHFIFNCLNSIQHFVLNSDGRSANFYIGRFAALVRSTLENAPRIYVSLKEELDYLKSYIELERMQLDPAFSYTLELDAGIDIHQVQVPNMVIQPLLENAIKHGVSNLGKEGHITLRFSRHDASGITCTLTDNGPGIRDTQRELHTSGRQSKGMAITKARIDILNQLKDHGKSITLEQGRAFETAGRAYGTRIVLFFPVDAGTFSSLPKTKHL